MQEHRKSQDSGGKTASRKETEDRRTGLKRRGRLEQEAEVGERRCMGTGGRD